MKNKIKKTVAWIAIAALVLTSLALLSGCLRRITTSSKVNITIWGTFETSEDMNKIINSFLGTLTKAQRKGLSINYKKIPMQRIDTKRGAEYDNTYEELLFSEIARGEGPDIFFAHNTWFNKHVDKMQPLFTGKDQIANFRLLYVPAVVEDLVIGESIYGIPLYVDSLAMYYNVNSFKNTPTDRPAITWSDFIDQIPEVEQANVSAVALGTANNISRASDIVLNFALQAGVNAEEGLKPSSLARSRTSNPLRLYTQFADSSRPAFSWDMNRDYYVDEFVQGDVAAIVGYSYLEDEINSKAGIGFNYDVAPIPQINIRAPVVLANYWAPVISRNSKNPLVAFEFLKFMSGPASDSIIEITGKPPARFDQIDKIKNEKIKGVFASQAKFAKTFPIWSDVRYDNIISSGIRAVNENKLSNRIAIGAIDAEINTFLRDFANIRGFDLGKGK